MTSPCKVCKHKDRAALEAEGRAAPSLDGFVDVCAKYDVQHAVLRRHLAKCAAATPTRRPGRARKAPTDEAPDSGPRRAGGARVEAPDSGPRRAGGARVEAPEPEAAPLPPPRELAAPDAELRSRARLLTQQLERMIAGHAEARHISSVAGALARVDGLILAREKGARAIHEHSDFDGLVMDLVAAVVEQLGPDAPEGVEGLIADRFEELQAARASAGTVERRAA